MIHDLETQLLHKGISSSHIERMKSETNELLDQKTEQYEFDMKTGEVTELVPVERIKSLLVRGKKGVSWFAHLKYHDQFSIDFNRMETNYNYFLESDELQSFYDYFSDGSTCTYAMNHSDTVKLRYYVDEDIYQAVNGMHRTLLAKVTGVPVIEAAVSKWYKK